MKPYGSIDNKEILLEKKDRYRMLQSNKCLSEENGILHRKRIYAIGNKTLLGTVLIK